MVASRDHAPATVAQRFRHVLVELQELAEQLDELEREPAIVAVPASTRGPLGRRGLSIRRDVLKTARLQRRLTLAEVAEGVCSRQAIHQYETGKSCPGRLRLQAICDRLGLRIEDVLAVDSEDVPTGLAS